MIALFSYDKVYSLSLAALEKELAGELHSSIICFTPAVDKDSLTQPTRPVADDGLSQILSNPRCVQQRVDVCYGERLCGQGLNNLLISLPGHCHGSFATGVQYLGAILQSEMVLVCGCCEDQLLM